MKPESRNNYESLNPDSHVAGKSKKRFFTKRKIILLSILLVIVGLCVWDIADPPLWWQFKAQHSKRLIMDYAHEHYPDAKIVKTRYESAMPLLAKLPEDVVVFEKDGVRFSIVVRSGKLDADGYYYSRAGKMIKDIIVGEFMNPLGLEDEVDANVDVSFQHGDVLYPFYDAPMGDLSNYNHLIAITINVNDKCSSPEAVDWLYDCYQYWESKCVLREYSISFQVYNSNPSPRECVWLAHFNKNSDIKSRSEFYAEFEAFS